MRCPFSTRLTTLHLTPVVSMILLTLCLTLTGVLADGIVRPPRNYKGSLAETAQEAIIIFQGSETPGNATEDLILKITIQGDVDQFGWIVPFPSQPQVKKEAPILFKELFDYVDFQSRTRKGKGDSEGLSEGADQKNTAAKNDVEVLSREVVGSFDVAVLRANKEGALNEWLDQNNFVSLPDGEDVIEFYRDKGYVFACMKVSEAARSDSAEDDSPVDVHPLRFSFKTGGRDGIYFPMKLTGLQEKPFDVNLYVFYRFWLNDRLSKFGYTHRGMQLKYRDWDTSKCVTNGGKSYSSPSDDPLLRPAARLIPNVKKLFQRLYPGERYYLTNIYARGVVPGEVREWSDDLWMFPYYTNRKFVPHDARQGGPAAAAWPNTKVSDSGEDTSIRRTADGPAPWVYVAGAAAACLLVILRLLLRKQPASADRQPGG